MKITKNRVIFGIVLLGLDIAFFGLVNPLRAQSFILFGGFAVLAVNCLVAWYLLLAASRAVFMHPKGRLRRSALIATVITTVLLALQSIGQLTLRDVSAVLALSVVFWLYSSYYGKKGIS